MAMDIDFDDTKTRIAIAIIAVGVVVAGLIGYFQIGKQFAELKVLKDKTAKCSEELKKILTLRPQLEKMRVEVAQLQKEMDSLEAAFPSDFDVPGLITSVTKVARLQKVTTMNFKPSGNTKREYYTENYFEMSISGSYHSTGGFFAQIANFDMLVGIDKVKATVGHTLARDLQDFDKQKSKKSDEMIRSVQTSFRITTYSSLKGAGK